MNYDSQNSPDLNGRLFSSFWSSATDEQGKTIIDINLNVKVDFDSIGLDGDIDPSTGCPGQIGWGGVSRSDLIFKAFHTHGKTYFYQSYRYKIKNLIKARHMTLGPFLDLILIKLCVPMLIPLRAQVGLRHLKTTKSKIIQKNTKYSE